MRGAKGEERGGGRREVREGKNRRNNSFIQAALLMYRALLRMYRAFVWIYQVL